MRIIFAKGGHKASLEDKHSILWRGARGDVPFLLNRTQANKTCKPLPLCVLLPYAQNKITHEAKQTFIHFSLLVAHH